MTMSNDCDGTIAMAQSIGKGHDNIKCLWDGKIYEQRS